MDDENCEGCEWKGNQCKKRDEILKADIMCPVNCFLPYRSEFFNSQETYKEKPSNNNAALVAAQEFIDFHSNPENRYSENKVRSADTFRCGNTYLNIDDPLPESPSKEMLYSLLSENTYSAYSKGDIKWQKIYPSDLLKRIIELSQNSLSMTDFTNNNKINIEGVKLEWYADGNMIDIGDFTNIISNPITRGNYVDEVPEYRVATGEFKRVIFDDIIRSKINDIINNDVASDSEKEMLGELLVNIDDANLIPEPAAEKRMGFEDNIRELRNETIRETSESVNIDYNITKLVHFFTITENDYTNEQLAIDFKNMLDTGDNDEDYINRIKEYTTFEDLGRNYEDLKYIERKIRKFLGLNIENLVDLFTNVDTISVCGVGFSEKPMRILLNLLELSHDDEVTNADLVYRKRALKIIYKFVPNLIKKVLDLSKRIEETKCDRITNKTEVYFEMYKDLFIESNALKFSLPDLGISDFFEDFTVNIHTKMILLIFIAFTMISIISLLKN